MTGLACAAALMQRGLSVVAYDEAPAGLEGPVGDDRADGDAAQPEAARRPGARHPVADLPRLVRGAVRPRRVGRARQDPAPAMDGLPALVPPRARAAGAQRPSRDRPRAAGDATADGLVALRTRGRRPRDRARSRAASCVATGRAGLGGPSLPAFADALPRTRWAHSSDDNDYAQLAGLRVGVVGAGASAMDSAATALEAGAAHVHLLVRRADLPRINKGKGAGNPGLRAGLRAPARRLEMAHPPLHQRAAGAAAAQQHAARLAPRRTRTSTSASRSRAVETRRRAAGAHLGRADRARLPDLRDRLQGRLAPAADAAPHRAVHPDLEGPLPAAGRRRRQRARRVARPRAGVRVPAARRHATAPGLERVHCLCYPATLSLGVITGDIPAISEGAQQLAGTLAGLLYAEDIEHHYERLEAYAEPEILGDEWVAEPLPPPAASTSTLTALDHRTHDAIRPSTFRCRRDRPRRRPRARRPAALARGASAPRSSRRRQASHDALLAQPVDGLSRRTACASPRTSARSPARRAWRSTTRPGWPTRRAATRRPRPRCRRCCASPRS